MKLTAHPLRVINYTELLFAFVAHIITIPLLGVLTGLMCGCAVLYTIRIQSDGSKPNTRRAAFIGTLVFKAGQLWIHQTSFLFMFDWSSKTLPFGWSNSAWAWFTTIFISALDIWALYVTSREANERAASDAEAQRKAEQQEREARAERERQARLKADSDERVRLAEIRTAAKRDAKLAAEETARKIAEEQRKAEEAKWKAEEAAKKLEEEKWKAEEEVRKIAEQERKDAERQRKEEERARKVAEAERMRLEQEEAEKRREKWRLQKQNAKINHHQPETAQIVET